MEFFCVLSVGGTLASYQVYKEGGGAYKAVLRTNNGRQNDTPAEITLKKEGNHWQAEPWHDEIVKSLVHAIEGNNR